MDGNYSLADLAAATEGHDGFLGGGSGALIILFLIICMMGGGGLWGGNAVNAATQADIQRAIDLNAVQQGQAGLAADIQRGIYEVNGATKDAAYNNLSEIRDVQSAVATGNANIINNLTAMQATMQQCCCETKSAIMENRYLDAQNTANITTAIHAEGEATRSLLQQNKIEALQNQINQLQLQNAIGGVQTQLATTVKYPTTTAYCSGANPFCNCNAGF